ncbi:MAG: 6-phosphogluconolactonase [Chlamydiota bacterium]
MQPEIKIVADANELSRVGAAEFEHVARNAVMARDRFTVCLSGGSTPRGLHSQLARGAGRLPWDKFYFFWGDERHVPPDDKDSNYRMARETLLSQAPIPPDHVFRMHAEEADAGRVAEEYEQTIRTFFALKAGEVPRFDLVLLGLGPDGHTASLFPGSPALEERSRLVVANWVQKLGQYRLTLTAPVINNAAEVMFLVSGAEKTAALQSVLYSDAPAEQFPAKLIQPVKGRLIWLVDRAALPSSQARPA